MARNHEAIAILEKSVALDPGYAPAWLALGMHYANDSDLIGGGEEMYRKTVAALQRAHELDPDLLAASTMLIERPGILRGPGLQLHANPRTGPKASTYSLGP